MYGKSSKDVYVNKISQRTVGVTDSNRPFFFYFFDRSVSEYFSSQYLQR